MILDSLLGCVTSVGLVFASLYGADLVANPDELPRIPPIAPQDALATLRVADGFRADLMIHEPQVVDPIAMAFDARGRLYVIEMRDYSERRPERLGRVRLLEDTNGDGRFDLSRVFLDDLPWPTALTCYDDGIFVGCTPDLIYARDENGDGRADIRETVFTGFGRDYAPYETNRLNVQALLNSLHWGLDNRIHGATSMSGGRLECVDSEFTRHWRRAHTSHGTVPSQAPLELRGRDFSFDPRTLQARLETGGGQHGMSFDDEGQKYVCSNSDHLQWVRYPVWMLPDSPYLPWPTARLSIASDGPAAPVFRISPEEPWRVIRTRWRVTGLVPGLIEGGGRSSGYFTGATGVTSYRGDALGMEVVGDVFIADCGSNLIHRKRISLKEDGLDRVGERVGGVHGPEFLASTDNWFRPVQMANAPDGGLWIADMYREVIEHPWSLPPGIKEMLDLNAGNDRGRLWRIVPEHWTARPAESSRLQDLDESALITLLKHPNGWHRDTASRLLYERGVSDVGIETLRRLLKGEPRSVTRYTALRVLEGSGRLNAGDWLQAFEDESQAVRRQALQLLAATLEKFVSPTRTGAGNDAPELEHGAWARSASLREAIGRRVAEEESQEVMWDILWVVTRFPEGERVAPLLTLLTKGNATIQSAALAASGNRMEELWAAWTRPGVVEDSSGGGRGLSPQQLDELLPRLARGMGLRGTRDDGNRVLGWVETPGASRLKLAVANEFVEGNQGRGEVGAREGLRLTQAAEGMTRIAQDLVRHATEPVSDTTLDAGGSREQNVAHNDIRERRNDFGTFDRWTLAEAVRWLGHSRDRAHNEVWLPSWITLVQRSMGEPVEGRVLEVLRRILAVDTPDLFRDVLPELQPSTFRAVARHLMQRDEGAALLLDMMEQRRVLPSHLDISLMAQLRKHGNVELRARAIRFLGEPPGSRQEAIRRALPALSLAGDGVRGRTRFIERCQVCHPFRGEGQRVGPDLASVVANGAESLLVAILDPNRDVAPNYVEVVVETSENEVLSGLLLDGDIARIRLVTGGGEVRELLRATVRDLQITGRSLMPEGLEEGWSTQDLADLLAYLTAAPK